MTSSGAPVAVTGIVLAGGRSARFGGDKLARELDGRPVLQHVLERLREVASDVVIVRAPDANDETPGARVVHDPEPFGGPRSTWGSRLARAVYDAVNVGIVHWSERSGR